MPMLGNRLRSSRVTAACEQRNGVQMVEKLGWKCLYLRPKAPDTRGAVAMVIEGGRMQVSTVLSQQAVQPIPCQSLSASHGR